MADVDPGVEELLARKPGKSEELLIKVTLVTQELVNVSEWLEVVDAAEEPMIDSILSSAFLCAMMLCGHQLNSKITRTERMTCCGSLVCKERLHMSIMVLWFQILK